MSSLIRRAWRSIPATFAVGSLAVMLMSCQSSDAPKTPQTQPAPQAIHWEKYSDEVFARAKKENRFVLIDLEAVWCHWCHVQDEITYADPNVIRLIDARYIAVKVDQDSRPDLSTRYEDYGWPATIVLNAKGGEIVKRQGYIPPIPMASLLQAIIDDPTPGPSVVTEKAIAFGNASSLAPALRKELEAKLDDGYDPKQGGWGSIHKFVDWDSIEYSMMRARAGDKQAERRARQTLDEGMKLIDPVWGGVYQYSTDGDWVHPHFEKLMQFQSEVMRIYSLGAVQFHDSRYRDAAGAIRRYVGDFLTSKDGVFYVSQDADLKPGEHSAAYFALDDAARRKLGVPRVDTHRYARENGWAIHGLLAWYAITQRPSDLDDARHAAEWIIANRSLDGGGFRHGEHDPAGPYLGDTLAMGRAFLDLYETTADAAWLKRAVSAADFIQSHFRAAPGDSTAEAGFIAAVPDPADPLAPKPHIDQNVTAARFFNLLGHYDGRPADHKAAEEAMRYVADPQVAGSRFLFVAGILLADGEVSSEPLHVTIVGKKDDPAARALFTEALKFSDGYFRLEWWDPNGPPLANSDVEFPKLSTAAAFVCSGNACSSPVNKVGDLATKLQH
ncbi:MAG TPA: DUF255 domain-containing protein [Tepidisphaeraceae bacterium]|jgi:hypothetical protein|nr:DUF255 domain-containing protein [Tepidisphaeraceae bacterium]